MTTDVIENGEKLVLCSKDPAVKKVIGHRRFLIGLDLGQAQDPSAWIIMRDEQIPEWCPSGQRLGERDRVVVAAGRIRETSYVDVARFAGRLLQAPAVAGRAYLAVDASGVGRAFCDVLDEMKIEHARVQMTGGLNANREGRFWNLGKNRLLGDLNGALHARKLGLGTFDMRENLAREFESFQIKWGSSGAMRLEGGDEEGHADLVIATSLALWMSNSPLVGGFGGSAKLDRWY